jgi:hypothetical protein
MVQDVRERVPAEAPEKGPAPVPVHRLRRRLLPLLATAGLMAAGMVTSTVFGAASSGRAAWALPYDLWGTLLAAHRLVHLDLGGLYAPPTGLITFPGAAVILAPVAALADALGLSLSHPDLQNTRPDIWLAAGPYTIALSATALFAADALAERMRVSLPKRTLLAAASAVTLWSVSVKWGHPEDAVAVALFLYAILALSDPRPARAGWLVGAAVAVQPLVLLGLPVLVAVVERRRLPAFLIRAATPAALLLGAAAAANWDATSHAVTSQPNWPAVDHPTPWTSLAPKMAGGAVSAGPGRILAILVACACGLVVWRRLRILRDGREWPIPGVREVLWWVALALAVRCAFESVMVAFYVWPGLAVALVAATRRWIHLLPASVVAVAVTFESQSTWRSPWGWWGLMVGGLGLALLFAGPPTAAPSRCGTAPRA